MKKKIALCLVIVVLSIFCVKVYAEEDTKCNYSSKSKLNKSASTVKATYDIRKDEAGKQYFEFFIYNISEDIYVNVSNDVTNEVYDITYAQTDHGTYNFKVNDIVTIIKYKFAIRGLKYGCSGDIKKLTVIKPRYNDISELPICSEDSVVETMYCQPWVTRYFPYDREGVIDRLNKIVEKNKKEKTTKCVACEAYEKEMKRINRLNRIRYAIILGTIVGIAADLCVIAYLIFRMKRYEI